MNSDLDIAEQLISRRKNQWLEFLRRLFREKPLSAFGFVIVVMMLVVGVFALQIAPYDYREQVYDDALLGHSWSHPMGTDQLGRDQFSRIIVGAQVSMIVGFACVIGFLIVSVIIGMGSGYIGGKFDIIVQRIVDGWMTVPTLILLLALVAVVGQGLWQIIFILAIDRGISMSRVLRGETLSLKETTYVEAARAMGAGHPRIFVVHLLPNSFAPMIVMATISLGAFILTEATLSFLGYGVPPPFPTWGSMLSGSALGFMARAPWIAIWPGIALTLAVWAFNMLGDGMRDLLDPRLRGN